MITVVIPEHQITVEDAVVSIPEKAIEMEHSLVALQKWESHWHKAYLSKSQKTTEEIYDYLLCMCVTPNVTIHDIYAITREDLERITAYINDLQTATTINIREDKSQPNGGKAKTKQKYKQVTAEIIYYWMIALNIPAEYRFWHLNQLLTLVKVLNVMNEPEDKKKKKRSRREILLEQRAINERNKQLLNTKG